MQNTNTSEQISEGKVVKKWYVVVYFLTRFP